MCEINAQFYNPLKLFKMYKLKKLSFLLLTLGFALFMVSCEKENEKIEETVVEQQSVEQAEKWQESEVELSDFHEMLKALNERNPETSRNSGTLINGGFEDGSTGWNATAEGSGINGDLSQAWIFGAVDPNYYFGVAFHNESLVNTGEYGASAVENGPTNHYLQQSFTMPEQECEAQTITLDFWMRWKNQFSQLQDPFWIPEAQDIIVSIGEDVIYSASEQGLPAYSGGGDENEAFYVPISIDVTGYDGQEVSLVISNRVCCYYQFLDLDDICINVNGICDSDGDGCNDDVDPHPESNVDATVIIDGCDSGVSNVFVSEDGCSTMSDLIADAAAAATNHGEFVSAVAALTNAWKQAGIISGAEKGAIQSCAGGSSWPL